MRLVKNKVGSGQFEMVVSFVFFIGFVFMLFMFLVPGDTTSLSNSVIEGLKDSFEDEVRTNMTSLFLKMDDTTSYSCFDITLPERIFKYNIEGGETRAVILRTGEAVDETGIVGTGLSILSNENAFRVAISPEFTDTNYASCAGPDVNYELGDILERQVVSYKALQYMRQRYYNNYAELREDLNVPAVYDFGITFDSNNNAFTNMDMMPRGGVPNSNDVLAKDFVFEVLQSDGTFTNERINFRIW